MTQQEAELTVDRLSLYHCSWTASVRIISAIRDVLKKLVMQKPITVYAVGVKSKM